MKPLQIQPQEFRDLLISECDWTKEEATEFVIQKVINQFGEIEPELKQSLEE